MNPKESALNSDVFISFQMTETDYGEHENKCLLTNHNMKFP